MRVLWGERLVEAETLVAKAEAEWSASQEIMRSARKEATEAQAKVATEGHSAEGPSNKALHLLRLAEGVEQDRAKAFLETTAVVNYAREMLRQDVLLL